MRVQCCSCGNSVSPGRATEGVFCDECINAPQKVAALQFEIERFRAEKDAETDEFNAGYDAFMSGKSADSEPSAPHDMWLIGYAWAKYCRETGMTAVDIQAKKDAEK